MNLIKMVGTKKFEITLNQLETGAYKLSYGRVKDDSPKELYLADLNSALWAFDVQLTVLEGN